MAPKTFEMANSRTTRMELERVFCRTIYFALTFKDIFLALAPIAPRMGPPLPCMTQASKLRLGPQVFIDSRGSRLCVVSDIPSVRPRLTSHDEENMRVFDSDRDKRPLARHPVAFYTARQKRRTNVLLRASFLILDRNWWFFSHTLGLRKVDP